MIANTPDPPYYVVIFSSIRTEITENYLETSTMMLELAKTQNGYLGVESARDELGLTVSYWKDLESIKKWKQHTDHLVAQRRGRHEWYKTYKIRIALVESDYEFHKDRL